MTGAEAQIHPDIPADKAWRDGRRIYIHTSYKTQLDTALRAIGAKWDPDNKALWVGSGKLDQVVPLVRAGIQRAATVAAQKTSGWWATIPYAATEIRQQAKHMGAVWDSDRKQWAMPTADALTQVQNLVDTWQRRQTTAKKAEAKKAEVSKSDEQVIAESGRVLVSSERRTVEGRLHGRMRRPAAEAAAPARGDVRRIKTGEYVLVLAAKLWFMDQDSIDDLMPHEEPGWFYSYTGVVVEPTADERAADAREADAAADEKELCDLLDTAKTILIPADGQVPRGPRIHRMMSSGSADGDLVLAGGEVWYHHPGYYDMWIPTTGRITEPGFVARVRAAVEKGPRWRNNIQVT